jgi:hypothetical protein
MRNAEQGHLEERRAIDEASRLGDLFADLRWVCLGSFFSGYRRSWGRERGFLASFRNFTFGRHACSPLFSWPSASTLAYAVSAGGTASVRNKNVAGDRLTVRFGVSAGSQEGTPTRRGRLRDRGKGSRDRGIEVAKDRGARALLGGYRAMSAGAKPPRFHWRRTHANWGSPRPVGRGDVRFMGLWGFVVTIHGGGGGWAALRSRAGVA